MPMMEQTSIVPHGHAPMIQFASNISDAIADVQFVALLLEENEHALNPTDPDGAELAAVACHLLSKLQRELITITQPDVTLACRSDDECAERFELLKVRFP